MLRRLFPTVVLTGGARARCLITIGLACALKYFRHHLQRGYKVRIPTRRAFSGEIRIFLHWQACPFWDLIILKKILVSSLPAPEALVSSWDPQHMVD